MALRRKAQESRIDLDLAETGVPPASKNAGSGKGKICLRFAVNRMAGTKVNSLVGFQFLMTEVDTGMTFARIALDARPDDTEKIIRNWRYAQQAYNAIIRFRSLVDIDVQRQRELDAGRVKLKSALDQIAERVWRTA